MSRDPLRLARDLAAAIGFVTAIVAFGKLLVSGWSSWSSVLPWLGWAYLALIFVGGAAGLIWPKRLDISRVTAGIALLVVAAVGSSAAVEGERTFLYLLGGLGAGLGLFAAATYYLALQRSKASSVKTCPDCAEDVKVAAKVCKHCGYRFAREEGTPAVGRTDAG
jgi:hypothetical protein